MENSVEPLPPGAVNLYPPGPEEVVIARLADPVQLKPAGQTSAFPLRFYDKRRRTNAGAWVFCAPGGRAEVLWPSGSSVVLFDRCTGIVGSPSRGEPHFIFKDLQRTVLMLHEGDMIELLGGAELRAESGPWVIEHRLFDILRVRNQSKVPGEVAYRHEVFILGPGETVDLPLLSAGGSPIAEMPRTRTIEGPGFDVRVSGAVEVNEVPGGVALVSSGEHEISGLGIRLHLAEGERAALTGFSREPAPAAEAEQIDPEPEPEPEPTVVPGAEGPAPAEVDSAPEASGEADPSPSDSPSSDSA